MSRRVIRRIIGEDVDAGLANLEAAAEK